MGHRFISYMLVLVLVATAFAGFTGSIAIDNGSPRGSQRTMDSDNSFAAATTMSNYTLYSNSVDSADDMYDYYKISLNANDTAGDLLTINFTLDYYFDNIDIYVYNPELYEIINMSYMPFWDGDFNRSICACTPGDYYIVLMANYGATDYSLTVYNHTVNRTTDNDNTIATATTAVDDGSYYSDLNATYDYLDLYNVSIIAGTVTTGINRRTFRYELQIFCGVQP